MTGCTVNRTLNRLLAAVLTTLTLSFVQAARPSA